MRFIAHPWRSVSIVFTVLAAGVLAAMVWHDGRPIAPIRLFAAPSFSFTDQQGQPFGSKDLAGSPYVIDFIFTRCGLVCPIMTLNMSLLQDLLDLDPALAHVQLVSLSVDPEHDTPEVLTAFAKKYDANPSRWHFLTGESRDIVWPIVEEGFKLPLDATPGNLDMPITHSSRIVLVDAQGYVRGYYHGMDDQDHAALLQALQALK